MIRLREPFAKNRAPLAKGIGSCLDGGLFPKTLLSGHLILEGYADTRSGRLLTVPFDLSSYAPYGNLMRGVKVEWLKEVGRLATAEPRRQSVRSELDKILLRICRANYDVVDATVR